MQAWPLARRGEVRDTHTRPTKSGVIGLVANALGRDRAESIGDLAALRFGVRVDRPGTVEVDYHTSGGGQFPALPAEYAFGPSWLGSRADDADVSDPCWMTYAAQRNVAPGKGEVFYASKKVEGAYLTRDLYLADASFLAGLQGPADLIDTVVDALASPARAVFLGRKAYGPASPLLELTQEGSLEDLFTSSLPSGADAVDRPPRFDVYCEPAPGQPGVVVKDQPLSFNGPIQRGARQEHHYTLANGADGDLFGAVFSERA